MSRHDHDDDCRCRECEAEAEDAERTSIEEAGGVAVGLKGHIHGFNADAAARMSGALLATGKWVEKESGSLLGHIKAAVYNSEGKGVTFNLTDVKNGVEQHGTLPPQKMVDFSFMSAVLDVDAHGLEHAMKDALDDAGLDYHLEGHSCDHDHDHDHKHDHDHDHDHKHDHDHDHDHKHDHGHDHKHDHDHDHGHEEKDKVCHCEACEDRRKEEAERAEKGSLWDKIRRRKK
ncbi:MAG: hydrogenase nickel incorporation protein HypA [Methanomassiliicoccaceae archaeon]|nr:hydrogenase nickel incorporation protein HypA [Methanomassiliicoccaceae archaeon]